MRVSSRRALPTRWDGDTALRDSKPHNDWLPLNRMSLYCNSQPARAGKRFEDFAYLSFLSFNTNTNISPPIESHVLWITHV